MQVGIIMGSKSDWPTMKQAADMLDALGVSYETRVVSAHRTPDLLMDYAKSAKDRGLKVILKSHRKEPHLVLLCQDTDHLHYKFSPQPLWAILQ